MKIIDHAKNYAQVFQNEREREIAYSGFLQGAKFQRSEDIEKAVSSYCACCYCGCEVDASKCDILIDFRRELKMSMKGE